jgi:hypothetical protein
MRLSRVVVVLVLLVLVAGAWLGWKAWQINRDLSEAVDDAARLQVAAQAGDDAGVQEALDSLREHSGSAADRTAGWDWSVVAHFPVVGDDARGVRLVSDVVHELSETGLEDLASTLPQINQLVPRDGGIPVDVLKDLTGPVATARTALVDAEDRLDREDSSGYVDRLRTKYRDLSRQVSTAADSLAAADRALGVLPSMLGDGETRNYLLVFQNNAEIRSTGGLPGAISLVTARDGQLTLGRQAPASSFGVTPQSVLPLSPAEKKLYGSGLGRFMLSVNQTPDFPRTAELARAHWNRVYDDQIDGVLSLDPVAISYLLSSIPPVQVGDLVLTEDNVVDELLHGVYLRYEDPVEQDAFLQEVVKQVFASLTGGGDATGLLRGLSRAADEGRVYVHSFDTAEQSQFADTQVAGELRTDPEPNPEVNVTLSDTTGAKMSYYLRYRVRVRATYCTSGTQGYSASATLRSDAPADAASLPDYITGGGQYGIEPGSQLVVVRFFAPIGGSLTDLQLNSRKLDPALVDQDGRQVGTAVVQLDPGQTVNLSWKMTSGPDQTSSTRVTVSPGIEPVDASSRVPSACG